MEWQPIETAPRDGRSVLCCVEDKFESGGYLMEVVRYLGKGDWVESNGEMYSCYKPTHWMPLPEPPKGQE